MEYATILSTTNMTCVIICLDSKLSSIMGVYSPISQGLLSSRATAFLERTTCLASVLTSECLDGKVLPTALIQGHQFLKICMDFSGFSGIPGTSGLAFLSHSFNLSLQLLLFLTFAKIRKRTIGGLTWFGHVRPCKVCLKDKHFPKINQGHAGQIAQTSNTLDDHKLSTISCSSFSQNWSLGKIFRAESS